MPVAESQEQIARKERRNLLLPSLPATDCVQDSGEIDFVALAFEVCPRSGLAQRLCVEQVPAEHLRNV